MELLHLNEVRNALPILNLPSNECPSNCIAHSVAMLPVPYLQLFGIQIETSLFCPHCSYSKHDSESVWHVPIITSQYISGNGCSTDVLSLIQQQLDDNTADCRISCPKCEKQSIHSYLHSTYETHQAIHLDKKSRTIHPFSQSVLYTPILLFLLPPSLLFFTLSAHLPLQRTTFSRPL